MLSDKFHELVQALKVLPGVGPKTAARMAIDLIDKKPAQALKLAQALEVAIHEIQHCSVCRSYSDNSVCSICQDSRRDASVVCVVESVSDLLAIEHSGAFRGRYFVLGGKLSPLDGIGAEEIGIPELFQQLENLPISEVIVATNATVEGQATAHFIQTAAQKKFAHKSLKVTRLAQGVPTGGELEYLDGLTLAQALKDRQAAK